MDPTLLFTASVVLVPLVYCADVPAAVAYLTQPSLLASYAVLAVIVGATRAGPCVKLAPRESRLAYWFLVRLLSTQRSPLRALARPSSRTPAFDAPRLPRPLPTRAHLTCTASSTPDERRVL